MGKTERLYDLEQLLLAHPRGCRASEIAKQLNVHRSLIYRDMEDLEEAGVPVVHDEIDELWWIDTTRYLNNVKLRTTESLVLYLAARRLIRQTHAGIPIILSALSKLAQALRQPTAQQLIQVSERLYSEQVDFGRNEVCQTLTQAWVEQRAVEIIHRKFQNPVSQKYTLHPYIFEPSIWGEGTYVIGYCEERGTLRTFKVERIEQASLTNTQFEIPSDLQADTLLRHAWGIWYEPDESLVHVKVHFTETVAPRVCETIWHPSQKLTPLSDGSLYWEVDVSGEMELLSWIRSWGPDVEVLEPQTLRKRVADDVRAAAAIYA